jgi:predicted RNA binding protein YcfA (HicA-like mRNA interferase family)
MSDWPSMKARRVLAALQRIGWTVKREASSHKVLSRVDALQQSSTLRMSETSTVDFVPLLVNSSTITAVLGSTISG